MQYCRRCVLPATFPGISFDSAGVCQFCRSYRGDEAVDEQRMRYRRKFQDLIERNRPSDGYDILMAYSGGKDSTYTLDLLVSVYKLRVLALTFDNAFLSPRATENIHHVCQALDVDHLMVRPAPDLLYSVFRAAARQELFAPKTLQRASTICTCCIGFVKSIVMRTAIERGIGLVAWGWSPGQAPIQSSVMQTNPKMARLTQRAVYEPLSGIVSGRLGPFFLHEEHFRQSDRFPCNVHPLAFHPYDEEVMAARNQELGWCKPDDTDANSTNCLLNAFANTVHKERYGFHPYAWEMANMVRCGVLSRQVAMQKIEEPEQADIVAYARRILFPADSAGQPKP